jgi:hypothetical protein
MWMAAEFSRLLEKMHLFTKIFVSTKDMLSDVVGAVSDSPMQSSVVQG